MFRLILFETKKIVKSSFFRILILAFFLLLVADYIVVYVNTIRGEDTAHLLEQMIYGQEENIKKLEDQLKSAGESDSDQIKEELEFSQEWIEKDKTKLALYYEENWPKLLQFEIDAVESQVDSMRFYNQTHTYTYPTLFTLETFVEQSKWMRDKEITPLFPFDQLAWLTFYDQEFSGQEASSDEVKEIFEERNTKFSSSGIHFINHFFSLVFGVTGIIFFLFLFADIVTKEGIGNNGPIHLLRTQPIHRDKILLSKFLTVTLLTFFILLVTIAISLIIGTTFDRFGDLEYPVLIYGDDRSFLFMDMGIFLFKSVGMFFLVLLFCYSVLFLISVITKKLLLAIGLSITILFVGISMSGGTTMSGITPYIPFQYFSVPKVITNELAVSVGNFNISYENGMITLSISCLLLLVLTYVISVMRTKFGN